MEADWNELCAGLRGGRDELGRFTVVRYGLDRTFMYSKFRLCLPVLLSLLATTFHVQNLWKYVKLQNCIASEIP